MGLAGVAGVAMLMPFRAALLGRDLGTSPVLIATGTPLMTASW